ncbi:MAG: sel1 repeat family protein [Candidatus Sericytochromatia bacterium]|nr:sel1 repeat family protein [Candidatus Tanganyikabacteria bacterium]
MKLLVRAVLAMMLAVPSPALASEAPGRAQEALQMARQAVRQYYEAQAAKGDAAAARWLGDHEHGAASLSWYRKAAEQGDAEAQGELAWRYDRGEDAPRDEAAALAWARRGAAAGDETAIEVLAERYRDGRGVPADLGRALDLYARLETDPDEEAIPALREAGLAGGKPVAPTFALLLQRLQADAAAGAARANWALYTFHREEFGIPDGGALAALPYLRRAAESRDPQAMTALGGWYAAGGAGLASADPHAALAWFREAALTGYSPAIGTLVGAYETGSLAARDPAKAMEWLRRGAMAGDPEAQVALAERLGTGTYPGGPPGVYAMDAEEALLLVNKASRAGNAHAMFLQGLYNLDGTPFARNPALAAEWLQKAANAGHEGAMVALAEMLEAGRGVKADQAKAFALYRDAGMLLRQGRAYRDGRGVTANAHLALDCFLAEFDRQHPTASEAMVWLGRMFEQGRGVGQDAALGLALYEESHSLAGAWLRAQYEDRLPGATLQSRLAAYRAVADELGGPPPALPADPAAALAWFRKAAQEYLDRFEDGTL